MTPQWAGRWARLRALLTRRPVLITFAVVSVTLLVYTLAGFFLVPRLVATYVLRYVEQRLGRRAEIGEVRVNPLLLKIEIKKFRLKEADGRPCDTVRGNYLIGRTCTSLNITSLLLPAPRKNCPDFKIGVSWESTSSG